jgi:hypothetical protein
MFANICTLLQTFVNFCEHLRTFASCFVLKSSQKFSKVCESMQKFAKVCKHLHKCRDTYIEWRQMSTNANFCKCEFIENEKICIFLRTDANVCKWRITSSKFVLYITRLEVFTFHGHLILDIYILYM